jgi:hypothetical protein
MAAETIEKPKKTESIQSDAALAAMLQADETAAVPTVVVAEPVVAHASVVEPRRVVVVTGQPVSGQSEEPYCGPISCAVACILVLLFWPAALCVPLCPCDRRRVVRRFVNG